MAALMGLGAGGASSAKGQQVADPACRKRDGFRRPSSQGTMYYGFARVLRTGGQTTRHVEHRN